MIIFRVHVFPKKKKKLQYHFKFLFLISLTNDMLLQLILIQINFYVLQKREMFRK